MRLCKNYKERKRTLAPSSVWNNRRSLSLQRTTGILTIVFARCVGRRGKKRKAFSENTSVLYFRKAEDVVISQNEGEIGSVPVGIGKFVKQRLWNLGCCFFESASPVICKPVLGRSWPCTQHHHRWPWSGLGKSRELLGGDGGQSPSGGGCMAWSQADSVTGLLHEVWGSGSSQNNFLSFDEITSRAHTDNKVDVIIWLHVLWQFN